MSRWNLHDTKLNLNALSYNGIIFQLKYCRLKHVYMLQYNANVRNVYFSFILVQTPASVQNIATKPSLYSVDISWTIPVAKKSSYITHFIIHLNGTVIDQISRAKHGNQYILRGLKPNTYYQVGIKTQDGNSKKSMTVYESFETKRAGKNIYFKSE